MDSIDVTAIFQSCSLRLSKSESKMNYDDGDDGSEDDDDEVEGDDDDADDNADNADDDNDVADVMVTIMLMTMKRMTPTFFLPQLFRRLAC